MADNISKVYLKIEQKVINLMLQHLDIIAEMVDSRISPEFFDQRHRPLVQAIFYTHGISDGKRLLTDDHYRSLLIEQGGKGDITIAMQVFHECMFGVHFSNTKENFDLLKRQLIDSFVHRKNLEALKAYNANTPKMGYLQATRQYVDDLSSAINMTETKNSAFYMLDELKDRYISHIEDRRAEKEKQMICNIPEIDEAMNVGFKAGHTTLIVGATGSHKCLAYYEKCSLRDGSHITVKEMHRRHNSGENLSILSYDEQKGKLYYQPVKEIIPNGHKKCLRITTSLGFSVDVTYNHPFLQLDGYNPAASLKVGEHVGMARHYKFGNKAPEFDLAFWLGCMYSDGGTSQPLYTFSNQDSSIVKMMKKSCKSLGGELKPKRLHGEIIYGNYYITSLRQIGKNYNLDGYRATEKSIHSSIFQWNKKSLVVFLRAMFACDGCFCCTYLKRINGKTKPSRSVVYASSSKQLATDVRDLLMKFKLVAKLDCIFVRYKGEKRESWQVKLQDSYQVDRFTKEIGFYGRKKRLAEKSIDNMNVSPNRNKDLVPKEIWELIERKFVLQQKSYRACRRAKENGQIKRIPKRGVGVNRDSLVEVARHLNNDPQLMKLAKQDVLWDEIVSIDSVQECETFDIAMPKHHNFVTNGFITHNTNLMLNIALQVFEQGANVLFLPLEMDWEDFVNRVIANLCSVSYKNLLNPKLLTDGDMEKIRSAKAWISGNKKFALLDVDEQVSVDVIRRELEKKVNYFCPDLVVVDYLGLLKTQAGFGQRHDLALGDLTKSLKFMGKKFGFHVLTAAQLGRADIKRMREEGPEVQLDSTAVKGSQEVASDAEFIIAVTKVPDEDDRLKLHWIKSRYGPSGFTKDLRLDADKCQISSMVPLTGTGGLKTDVMAEMDFLNEPVDQIAEKIEQYKQEKAIEFNSMDPDELDDIG